MTDGGGMEASFLACQFLPVVVRRPSLPSLSLLFLFRPPAATLILPSHSAAPRSLSETDSFLFYRVGEATPDKRRAWCASETLDQLST